MHHAPASTPVRVKPVPQQGYSTIKCQLPAKKKRLFWNLSHLLFVNINASVVKSNLGKQRIFGKVTGN